MAEAATGADRMNQIENEEQEFRALVHELSGPLLRFAAGFLRDPHAAHDVVQEALLRVWKRRAHRYADSSRAYCYRAVRNQCVSYLRKKKLRKRVESETPAMPEQAVNPQHEAAREAWQRALQLPEELREIVVLHYGHGLSVSEVAEATDKPRGTIATRLRRALESLRGTALAAPVAFFPNDASIESALRSRPELASDVHVSSSLITGLEAAVMAGIGSKSIWGVAAVVALVLLLSVGVTVVAVGSMDDPSRVNTPLPATALDEPQRATPPQKDEGDSRTPAVAERENAHTTAPDDTDEVSGPPLPPDEANESVQLHAIRVVVRGLVVDDEQIPVAHAEVSVAHLGEMLSPVRPAIATTTSGADGTFEATFAVEPIDPGFAESSAALCAWASSHGKLSVGPSFVFVRWFVDDEEVVHDDLVLQVRQSRITRVRVQDGDGNPITGARVWWRRFAYLMDFGPGSPGPEITPEGHTLEFITGPEGIAEVNVPMDEQMQAVQVFADGFVGEYVTLSGKRDNDRDIVVTLRPARPPLTIEVQDTKGQPLANLPARVFWGNDDPLSYLEASLRQKLRTDGSGVIHLKEADEGELNLAVNVEGYQGDYVSIKEGQSHAVIQLQRKNRIEVRFQSDSGRSLELRDAHIVSSAWRFSYSIGRRLEAEWSGDEDEVVFDLTFAGWTPKVRITLTLNDGAVQTRTIKPPETGLLISGGVLLSDGKPAGGAFVFYGADKTTVERALAEVDQDNPSASEHSVMTDTAGRFELRLNGYTTVWIQALRRGVRSECVSVNYRDGVGEAELTLEGTAAVKLLYSEALASARPLAVVIDDRGNVLRRAVPGVLPVREALIENLPPGSYRVTLMTSDSRVAPFDEDPYTYELNLSDGDQAVLDLGSVEPATVTAKLRLGEKVPVNDGMSMLMWIRIGANEDLSAWRSIGHVLETQASESISLKDSGECEVKVLPGRYVVLFYDGDETSWASTVVVTDRPQQQLEIALQKLRR